RQQFSADLAAFTSNSATMTPAMAADAWLRLVEGYWALPKGGEASGFSGFQMMRYQRPDKAELSLTRVFAAMPGPASWPILETRTASRKGDEKTRMREVTLRVFTQLLNRNWNGAVGTLDEAIRSMPKDDDSSSSAREQLMRVRRDVDRLAKGEKSAGMVAEFERLMDAVTNATAEEISITIPELAGMVGTNEATRLIEKAVRIPHARIRVMAGPVTRRLVKAAVLKNLDAMTVPQWQLVRGTEAVELYDAMIKRFPPKAKTDPSADDSIVEGGLISVRQSYGGSRDYEQRAAEINYLLGLLAAGRQDDALRLVKDKDLDCSGIVGRHREGMDLSLPAVKVFHFAKTLLQQKPDARVWGVLVSAGLEAECDAEVLAALSAPHPALSDPGRQAERDMEIAQGYLALDRIDDGVAVLRKLSSLPTAGVPDRISPVLSQTSSRALRMMIDLGCVLDRKDLVDEGYGLILKMFAASPGASQAGDRVRDYEFDGVINTLVKAGRYQDAETLAIAEMDKGLRSSDSRRGYGGDSRAVAQRLAMMASIYGAAGRHSDVLTLLEKAPWWGVEDIMALQQYSALEGGSLMTVAATALLAQGRTNDATRVVRTYLMGNPGDDRGYAVLAQANEPDTMAWLEGLYARDRFEERPLIWKAVLQLKAGHADEAEKTIRMAISVDPTDGETRPGDRVRSYAVLADVLEVQGKTADATLFRNVVASVRLAEKGDAMTEAGLLRRSVSVYEQASKLFAAAYCVQWRLAERLYATGHPLEAEKHYELVFENMPEQFGRVAQLCFGCEGIFDRLESRSVAERILTRMAANLTVRPQVFFLLGQLREAQGLYPEAYDAFRKSVEIDREYLDGWQKLSEITEEVAIPQSERDTIYLRMLDLDPLCCHFDKRDRITDLKGLWETVLAHQKLAWESPKTLWPLPASKAALIQKRSAAQGAGVMESDVQEMEYNYSSRRMPSPGETVLATTVMSQALESLSTGDQ
ncbi:MAG: hypothetical protein WCO77_05090, partial [bacterium]